MFLLSSISAKLPKVEPIEESKGCFGSVTATSPLVFGLTLAGVALLSKKRKDN